MAAIFTVDNLTAMKEIAYCGKGSSTLWRESGIDTEHCDIEIVQREMLTGAKNHLGRIPQSYRADFVTSPIVAREDIDETVNFALRNLKFSTTAVKLILSTLRMTR